MQSVTSNAVARAFGNWVTIYSSGTSFIKGCKTPMGTFLRIRMNGYFGNFQSAQNIPNSYLLYTFSTEWAQYITYAPNRFNIAVDTSSVRLSCGVDVHPNGNMLLYFQDNVPLAGTVSSVIGLYCDALLLLQ